MCNYTIDELFNRAEYLLVEIKALVESREQRQEDEAKARSKASKPYKIVRHKPNGKLLTRILTPEQACVRFMPVGVHLS